MTEQSQGQTTREKVTFIESKITIEDYADIRRMYVEFKRMRKIIGKPITDKLDPVKTKKDLSGRDFFC